MSQTARAVYENGQLRLLNPLNLAEGEKVEIVVMTMKDVLRAALGDMVLAPSSSALDAAEEARPLDDLRERLKDVPSLSQAIIEERREGR